MTRFLLIAVLATMASATGAQAGQPGKTCLNGGPQTVGATPGKATAKRLDTLPPAAEVLTVIRLEAGCMKPVVVRYGIAGNPKAGAALRE